MAYKDQQLLEDIYDLVKECGLPQKQENSWTKLCRKFSKQAKKNLHSYLRDKNMEWDGSNNTIKIGEHVVLQLIVK